MKRTNLKSKRKTYLSLFTFTISVGVVIFFFPKKEAGNKKVDVALSLDVPFTNRTEIQAIKTDKNIERSLSDLSVRAVKLSKVDVVENAAYKDLVKSLFDQEKSVNRKQYLKAAAQSLLQAPDSIDFIKNNLVNFEKSSNFFLEDHAVSRAMGVDLLIEMAELGSPEYLIEAHQALLKKKMEGSPFSDEQDIDRIELLRGFAFLNPDRVLYDLPGMLSEIGHDDSLSKNYLNYFWAWFQFSLDPDDLKTSLEYLRS